MATKADIQAYTEQAKAAYKGAAFNGLYTSSMHAAHCIGEHMQATGRPEPTDVRPGRGDTIHVRDMTFRLDWRNVKFPSIERIK